MNPLRRHLVVAALSTATALAACGGEEAPAAGGATTTAAAAPTTAALATSSTLPAVSTLPEPASTPVPTAPTGPVQVDVVVGVDSSPTREERVRIGEDFTLNITNPNSHDEFHIHGIELEQTVEAGVMATFNFTADTPGRYEVESHETGEVLVVIVVE